MSEVIINKIPAPTWNWLHMNEARLTDEAAFVWQLPAEAEEFSVEAHTKMADPLRLSFEYTQDWQEISCYEIKVGEEAEAVILMDFFSQPEVDATAAVRLHYDIEKNGKLTIIQTQRLGRGVTFINDITGDVGERASFNLIQVVLSGHETYLGCTNELIGRHAALDIKLAYLVQNEDSLDINYVANHIGKKTESNIKVNGVLRDKAQKLFRGSIDFKNGCSASVGAEIEDVLLMDEGVVNRTIPLILCAEEDVEGTHGATIGKLSDEMMFYLKSRGIPEDEIYEMMARARIDAIASQIPDETTRNLIAEYK
ncbi:MAG: SufD family Fe-S cluster assembly protein [Lachnospiraceae bacterium]|nr:SufD family Fe-S cluster assembly protein [Lachnospiraceae bacterium]